MRTNLRYILFWFAALIVVAACNKPLVEATGGKETTSDTAIRKQKALLILIDGAVGDEYRAMSLPTLKSLEQNSLFSYDGLNSIRNETVTVEQSWASIMTGVTAVKHQVTQSWATNNFAQYPSLLTRLKQVYPASYSVSVAADAAISGNLFTAANEKFVFANNDAEVNNKAKALLAATQADLAVVHFNTPNQAGLASSFSTSSPAYVQAAQNIDSYIKQQIDAIKARANFARENWLVAVVSSIGSATQSSMVSWNAFEDKNHNTFYFYFNPRFQTRSYNRPTGIIPYTGSSHAYSGTSSNAIPTQARATSAGNLYDFGADLDFSVQCKVKVPAGSYSWPTLLGKATGFDNGTASPGWCIYSSSANWSLNFYSSAGRSNIGTNTAVNDGSWHTLAFVVKNEGTARNAYTFTDGVKTSGPTNIKGLGNINSTAPLTVGTLGPTYAAGLTSYLVTDVRIYNVALPDSYISNNYCKTEVDDNDVYKPNLLGFWPSNRVLEDANGKYFEDRSGRDNPLRLGTFNPVSFTDASYRVCPPITETVYNQAPLAVDVASQIYSWLGIPARPSWNLDGKSWIPNYSNQ